jgi:hypothetical protein
VVLVDRAQSLRQKRLQFPLEDPFPVLGIPHEVELAVVGAVRIEPNLHAVTISQNPAGCAGPACGWGGFHTGLTPGVLSLWLKSSGSHPCVQGINNLEP